MAAKRVFKSKRKVSNVRCVYRKWGEWEVGDIIIGKYVKKNIDNYDKPNWIIQVEEVFFANKKEAKRVIEGKFIGLNSSGFIDGAMEEVKEGELVQIEYKGMEEMTGGKYKGKDKHLGEVDIVTDGSEEEEEEETDGDDGEDDGDDL